MKNLTRNIILLFCFIWITHAMGKDVPVMTKHFKPFHYAKIACIEGVMYYMIEDNATFTHRGYGYMVPAYNLDGSVKTCSREELKKILDKHKRRK